MRRKPRRDITVFSLSFLDCISCGFGAVILLFVISLGSERLVIIQVRDTLLKVFQQRMSHLTEIRTKKEDMIRQVQQHEDEIREEEEKKATMQTVLEEILRLFNEAEFGKKNLVVEILEIRKELDARQQYVPIEQKETPLPVGVGVESNYLVFILDTSGSMRNPSTGMIWSIVIRKIMETLEVYPIVKGIQIMDANGSYILPNFRGQWMPDSAQQRANIVRSIQWYERHSESNPVPGIMKAIRTFSDPKDPEKHVGIYVFGDEFTQTADAVLRRIDQLNPLDEDDNRPVKINAIGFPHVVKFERHYTRTGQKFANLMRELTFDHGGAFVGIEN